MQMTKKYEKSDIAVEIPVSSLEIKIVAKNIEDINNLGKYLAHAYHVLSVSPVKNNGHNLLVYISLLPKEKTNFDKK